MVVATRNSNVRRLRVAHITEAPLGGVLSHIEEVLSAQSSDPRIDSIYVLASEVNLPRLKPFASSKVHIEGVPVARGSIGDLLRLALKTINLAVRFKPDVVHIHSTFAGAVSRPAAFLARTRSKLVYCPHGWAFARETGRLQTQCAMLVERSLSWITDAIVCVSDSEMRLALSAGISRRRCEVIENGIRPSEPRPVPAKSQGDKTCILFVGRFDRQKGFDIFLEVMELLQETCNGVAIGDFLVSAGERPRIPANVTVLKWLSREELDEWYAQADLLFMPSRWEGLPIVAIEAMRAGLPVFASPVGGLIDLVVDGQSGRLFQSLDPLEIADTISQTSRNQLREYGAAGHRRFRERFEASIMNHKIIALYERLCQG